MRHSFLCALLFTASASHAAQPTVRTIALSGQKGPGLRATIPAWTEFARPTINNRGDVLFGAYCGNPPFTGITGQWVSRNGELTLSHYSSMPAPGVPGSLIYTQITHDAEYTVLSDSGQVAFIAALSNAGDNGIAIYSGQPGNINLLARRGSVAPGFPPPPLYSTFSQPRLNAAGQMVFSATMYPFASGLFFGSGTSLTAVLRTGH